MYDNAEIDRVYLGQLTLTADVITDFPALPEDTIEPIGFEIKVTTTFAGATNTPKFRFGTTTDPVAFMDWDPGALAASNVLRRSVIDAPPSAYKTGKPERTATLRCTCLAATGAGAAGVAHVYALIKRR